MDKIFTKMVLVILIHSILVLNSRGQDSNNIGLILSKMPDDGLALKLASDDEKEATKAALEIFKRGKTMIPHLMNLKGVKSIYEGYCLNDYKGGVGVSKPSDETSPKDADVDNGWYVTVEVASLYLISAIYYKNISFAQVPHLTGNKYVKGRRYNIPKRVRKAWKATEKWFKKFEKKGIEKLRQSNEFPLKTTEIHFYGTEPQRERDISDCGQ